MRQGQADGVLGLLHPIWEGVIGGCLLLVLVVGLHRLLQRGPSRMTNGVLVTGLLIVAITVLGVLAVQLH
jgi:hypothetical protein